MNFLRSLKGIKACLKCDKTNFIRIENPPTDFEKLSGVDYFMVADKLTEETPSSVITNNKASELSGWMAQSKFLKAKEGKSMLPSCHIQRT